MATPQPFTIAISGFSSAGKSSLAFLLAEIFSGSDSKFSLFSLWRFGVALIVLSWCWTFISFFSYFSNILLSCIVLLWSCTPSALRVTSSLFIVPGRFGTLKLKRTVGTETNKISIIHGDEFFMPKHLCPFITFTSTPKDTAFCQTSLKDDEIGEYIISWNGTRANDPFMTYTPPTSANVSTTGGTTTFDSISTGENNGAAIRTASNDSVATTFSVASTLYEGGRRKIFTISGPDTDCDEAVNFVRMFEALKKASKGEVENVSTALGTMKLEHETKSDSDSEGGGAPLSSPTSEHSHEGIVELFHKKKDNVVEDLAPPHPYLSTDIPALKAEHANLIKDMKEKVQNFLVQSLKASNCDTTPTEFKLPKMVIIESFLLFSSPSSISPSDANPNVARLLGIFHSFLQKLEDLSTKLAEKGDVDNELEQEREYIEKNIQTINSVCKKGMMERFACKLWLLTSEKTAKDRRFTRPAYIDAKDGGLREPGQMWKTEGYFDQVVCKNHAEKHEWLVGENEGDGELGRYKEGIHIRAEDLGVGGTVRWAVGAVLEEMGKLVTGEAKVATGPTCGGCENREGKGGDW